MRGLSLAAAGLMIFCAAACSPVPGAAPDAANIPQSAATLRAEAAQACSGSGFPANGSVAAPGVPCYAAQGMTGGPPEGVGLTFAR